MPLDTTPKKFVPKAGLKQMSGQKSMFENKPKPPTQQQFQEQVQEANEKLTDYKKRASELFTQFNKTVADKTLASNRNVLNIDAERELLQNMIQLAMEINNDPNEQDCMGSLTVITCLMKINLAQRDRINDLEHGLVQLKKRMDARDLISKQSTDLDKAPTDG